MAKIEIDTDDMVSIEDAAVLLNISLPTIYRWMRKGKLKTVKVPRRTLVSKSALAKMKTLS